MIKNPSGARRSHTKHESIIRAAADVAEKAGYENSTIEGVAVQAGVGKQTITGGGRPKHRSTSKRTGCPYQKLVLIE